MSLTEEKKNQVLAHMMASLLFRISRAKCVCNDEEATMCPACLAEEFFTRHYFSGCDAKFDYYVRTGGSG